MMPAGKRAADAFGARVEEKITKKKNDASASDALNLAWSAVNSQGSRIVFSSLQMQPGTTLS
jgi:hypothetical protein